MELSEIARIFISEMLLRNTKIIENGVIDQEALSKIRGQGKLILLI
jgi:hypothetical protein